MDNLIHHDVVDFTEIRMVHTGVKTGFLTGRDCNRAVRTYALI